MILSRYTQPIEDKEGGFHLFNCLSKKWITLHPKLYKIFQEYKDDIKSVKDLHPDLYTILIAENFIVKNQKEDIRMALKHVRDEYDSTEMLNITVNPTLDCNLRCWYCYENRHHGSIMSESMICNTISFVKSMLKKYSVKILRLSFFGGEPLLHYKKVVHPIINGIRHICDEIGTSLSLHFTTNGILITDRLLNDLKDFQGRVCFQIAFDGGRPIHNLVKSTGTGSDCYSLSLKNVIKAIDAGYNVTVRCNYSKKTLESFMNLIEDLEPYHDRTELRFLFQKIWQEHDDEDLRKIQHEFFKTIEKRFKINSNLHEKSGHSLSRCYADYKNNFVINYDGKVFKCTARDFSDDYCIGHITGNGYIPKNTKETCDFTYSGFCHICRILPICPSCSQGRLENKDKGCPIDVDEDAMIRNMKAVFSDLTGLPVSI